MPALTTRPLGFRPSPPTIAELYFCIHAYQACCKACISSGDGWARFSVESRMRNMNFGMVVLRAVLHVQAEDCPPPCASATNERWPFGHGRTKKTTTRRIDSLSSLNRLHPLFLSLVVDCHEINPFTVLALHGRSDDLVVL